MTTENIVLLGCGDVGPAQEPVAAYSTLVRPILAAADIRFGQCERLYSERGTYQVPGGGGIKHRLKARLASVFGDCGFNVVSLAGNHAMDYGEDALLDTIAVLKEMGIRTVG